MLQLLREFIKSIPTFILSFALAVAVWISAVTAADPVRQQLYPRPVSIERLNQDPSLVITGELPTQATVTLSAPSSVWDSMLNDRNPIRAYVDLAGLKAGTHTVEVHIQPLQQPVQVISQQPTTVQIKLEQLLTKQFPIHLVRRGDPAVGFQAGTPVMSQEQVTVSGPASNVERVNEVRAVLNLSQASDNINRSLTIEALDANEAPVEGITVTPQQVTVTVPITHVVGFRNVVVKVVTTGQPAVGYRLTNISVSPPNVTVFSSDPTLVESLPGYIETSPLDLTGVKDDVEVRQPLNLPKGVSMSGEQTVSVQVGVAAIEDSVTLSGLPLRIANLPTQLQAKLSPTTVDVIVSGPVLMLDKLTAEDISVVVDLTNVVSGTYQMAPKVTISMPELTVESILPSSVEVVVEPAPTPTPTAAPTITPTPTKTGQKVP